jgi:hypothetical protein
MSKWVRLPLVGHRAALKKAATDAKEKQLKEILDPGAIWGGGQSA